MKIPTLNEVLSHPQCLFLVRESLLVRRLMPHLQLVIVDHVAVLTNDE